MPNRPQLPGSSGKVSRGLYQPSPSPEKQGPLAGRRSPAHAVRAHFHNRACRGEGVRAEVLHLCAEQRGTQGPATQAACRAPAASGSTNIHTPARATPSGNRETQGESLSPSKTPSARGRGFSSTHWKAPRDPMSQGGCASLLLPLHPASGLQNKNSRHHYKPSNV